MTLTAKDVAEITRLLEESAFDELELEIDGLKLSLKRGAAARVEPDRTAGQHAAGLSGAGSARGEAHTLAPATPVESGLQAVTAPMLGTFYRAPKPGAPPFVEVGAQVEADTVVGIIEVMKLMNAVRAGVCGTVTDVLARDGMLVEYGEVLLRVRGADGP